MRSVYARILLVSFAAVLLSLAGFLAIFFASSAPMIQRSVHAFEDVLADDAVEAFSHGGTPALAAYLARVDALMPTMKRYLVDANGRDVVTGADRSAWLKVEDGRKKPTRDDTGRDILLHSSSDGRYTMVIAAIPPVGLRDFMPYFALMLGAVAFVCWLLAVGIASPIRQMVPVVNEFGAGRFSARTRLHRRDEIGELSHAFDEMAERIETLVTAERRLLQDVSHELRSPLARLSMAIELSRTAQDRNAATDRLQRETNRLTHLVDALLEVTRLEGDPASTEARRVDVSAVIRDVVADCELEAEAGGCRIAFESNGEASVMGDPEPLRRAFENVLRNAIRYAPRGTAVEMRCDLKRSDVLVSVRDFGPGVPDDALGQLGSPFYRVDSSRAPSTGGLGLGLAIARRAVQLHHGRWHVENAAPGLRIAIAIPSAGQRETMGSRT